MAEQLLFAAAVEFQAARRLTLLPEGHRSARLHGHGFVAKVRVALAEGWAGFPGGEVAALHARLLNAVAPLDYNDLNRQLAHPTDVNLARWIGTRLDLPGVDNIGIQSTRHEGADLDRSAHAYIWRRFSFEAAHRLPNVPKGHKCGAMHGHGFEVVLHAMQISGAGEPGADHERLDKLWAPLYAQLDHACLNEISGLANPTSEMISSWMWKRLKPELPELSWVTVYETATCGAHFDGSHYRIWKEINLDSSLRLKRAPAADPRRRLHGHTYALRLHLHAPLDEVLGWTVDFGDVKEVFTPTFELMDHKPLHEIPHIADNDAASLVRWIRQQAAHALPQLDRIDLYETRGCGAILSWNDAGPAIAV